MLHNFKISSMNWMALVIAGIFEIGWPLGLKLSQQPDNNKWTWILFSIACMTVSGGFLWYAQKSIPIGTAYAVWTGIGAVGTLLVGVLFFQDSANIFRLLSALLIVVGIVGLKLF
ncbi:DMT family transporter [Chryseobacterium sp. YR221]|uniref:DMT family transporter n=1 Tax=Chryseobacterium sp. YR221 TaxID=1500293 RepID=UPI0021CD4800|nr:multidrug efflux SMR transporter [Chryseobacterium sp. YR221]